MSLLVWLPFTDGTLKQQGKHNIEAVINGTTSFEEGKLGTALKCNGSSYWSVSGLSLNNRATITCWTKTSINGKMSWVLESNASDLLNLYESSIYTLNTGDGNSNPFQDDNGASINCLHDGEWHHFAVTWDGTNCILYIDGEYKGKARTYRNPSSGNATKSIKIGGGYYNSHTYDWNGMINDFRLYDECLSLVEIKRISRGLIMHYPLRGDNNVMVPFGYQQLEYIESSGSSYFNTNYHFNPEIDSCRIDFKGNDIKNNGMIYADSGGKYFWVYYYYASNRITLYASNGSGQQTTGYITQDLERHVIEYKNKYFYIDGVNKGGLSNTYVEDPNTMWMFSYGGSSYPFKGRIYYLEVKRNNQTRKIYIPAKRISDSSVGMYEVINDEFFTSASGTSFIAGPGIAIPSIIRDNSGYNNDGIISGTLSINTDTPKYKYSTTFASGANYINAGRGAMVKDSITVNLWCKFSTWGNPISCTEGGGWNFESINENGIQFPVYISGVGYVTPVSGIQPSTLLNGWHMLTGTVSGTEIKIYIDGVLKGTKTKSASNNIAYAGGNAILIGAEASGTHAPAGTAFIGNISDVRIYATALSPEDIKSLYQNCVTIDSDGVIRGQLRG